MKFIQFYNMSTGYIEGSIPPMFDDANKKPIEACGSDSIFHVDGRLSMKNIHRIAKDIGTKRKKFCGYKIMFGPSLIRSTAVTEYVSL